MLRALLRFNTSQKRVLPVPEPEEEEGRWVERRRRASGGGGGGRRGVVGGGSAGEVAIVPGLLGWRQLHDH